MFVHTALFLFLPFLCRKELKFGKGFASSAVWSELLASFVGDPVGFCHVLLVGIFPDCVIRGGSSVLTV